MVTSGTTAKRLAKNTAFMYIRMAVLMCISLYTSRIVLKELGVEDFGIYCLVGSIVSMFASVRTLFSASTQRFLNFEMGRNNSNDLSGIFDTSVYINILISLVFIAGVESLGLWFLNNEINIDSSRLAAAQMVFQLSLVAAVIGIFTTSYDAVIIAHEKMDFYAYLSIVEGALRLGIVYLLQLFDYDKLIIYGLLTLSVSIIVLLANYIYCRRYFLESRFNGVFNKQYFKEMTTFAGWNFFGVTAFTLTQNGLNMILNVFGGPIVNAARGLAYQITGVLNNFMNNIAVVLNPYGTKLYASGEIKLFFDMVYFSSKILFFIQCCIVLVVLFFINEFLTIWLELIPDNTALFLKLVLLNSVIRSLHSSLDLVFKAYGKLKQYQLFEGIILSLPLFVSYLLLSVGFPCYIVFVLVIIFEFLNLISMMVIAKFFCNLSVKAYYSRVLFPCSFIFVTGLTSYFVAENLSFVFKLLCLLISLLFMTFFFFIFLKDNEKRSLSSVLKIK